ncbi:MAG: PucR family transcriptional regulator [Sporichthyaceae bacterium]
MARFANVDNLGAVTDRAQGAFGGAPPGVGVAHQGPMGDSGEDNAAVTQLYGRAGVMAAQVHHLNSLAEEHDRVQRVVVAVGGALNVGLGTITASMGEALFGGIGELGDQRLLSLLAASIQGNMENISHMLVHDVPASNLEPPSAAFEYARRLAQHDVPVHALVRAYRLGQDHLLGWAHDCLAGIDEDAHIRLEASQRIVAATFAYVDWISERVVTEYEAERERWLMHRNTKRAIGVRELIDGVEIDVEAAEIAIGYRLRQYHLGVVVWMPEGIPDAGETVELERVVSAIGEQLAGHGQLLYTTCDRRTGWAWLPLGSEASRLDSAAVGRLVRGTNPNLRVALGGAAYGRDGFRASHLQARQAQRVASVAGPDAAPATDYLDPGVRAAALLCADLENTRMLVRTALGPLARTDEQAVRLRETLGAFLSTGSGYTATAELLCLHKNSVKYRVEKAEELRGGPIEPERFDIELALVACRLLGRAVLDQS